MTFREYWAALGFGALSPKARATFATIIVERAKDEQMIQELHSAKLYLSKQLHLIQTESNQRFWTLTDAQADHLDYAKKLADALLQKNSIRPLMPIDAPKRDPKPHESAGGLAALAEDYDKVQEEDRLKYGPVAEEDEEQE